MDRNYVADRQVVARYLSDQLTEEESRGFEEYMLAHPEVVHELESTARLKVGLHKLNETGELTILLKPKALFGDTRFTALAASLAVIAVGLLLLLRNVSHELPTVAASIGVLAPHPGARLPIGNAYAIVRTRGNSYDAQIDLPDYPQALELRVLPDIAAHPARYRATLARIADDDSSSEVGAVAGLIPDQDGFVLLYCDSSKLTRGRYRLSLGGDAGTDAVDSLSTFKLRVNPASGH